MGVYELYVEGRSALAAGEWLRAIPPLEEARDCEPDKASIREALGIAYYRIHRWQEAEREFRALLEIAPTNDYAYYALGRCREKQGDRREAATSYKLACCLRPGQPEYEQAREALGEGVCE